MGSDDLIRELRKAGWVEVRCVGSLHIFKHPKRPGHLTVPQSEKGSRERAGPKDQEASGAHLAIFMYIFHRAHEP
jgi:hypothetical protein